MKIVPDLPRLAQGNKQQEERKAPAEFHLVASVKRVKGHILFSYNTKTGKWKQAPIKREVTLDMDGNPICNTSVAKEKDCVYIQALNLKNAKKKLSISGPN
jgi:hypothetical protein